MSHSRSLLLVAAPAAALAVLVGCGGPVEPPAPVTVTVTASPTPEPTFASVPTTPTMAPVTQVVIPDVEGMNGALALERLEREGLTNVQAASRDEEDKVVLYAANWTVTSIEPGVGTEVSSDSTVIVTMTKQ